MTKSPLFHYNSVLHLQTMGKIFFLVLGVFSANYMLSQNILIKGKIIDESSQKPMPYVSVAIYKNDSMLTGILTNEQGQYMFNIPFSLSLSLRYSFMGYEHIEKKLNLISYEREVSIEPVVMKPDAKLLDAVQVSAEKATFEMNIDRKVFNVDKTIQATGGTAQDVLKNIPTLSIDQDGNATVRNNKAEIYIDGQPTPLELEQIPADQIDQVEIITNPSARFDASSKNGIINIRMKRSKKQGINGSISAGIGTNKRYNTSLNLNYGLGKWNFFSAYNYNGFSNPTQAFTDRTNYNQGAISQYYNQQASNVFTNSNQMGRIGFDYLFSAKHKFSLSGTYSTRSFQVDETQHFKFLNPDETLSLYGNRLVSSLGKFKNISIQPTWQLEYGKHEFKADLVYTYSDSKNTSAFNSSDFNAQDQLLPNNPNLQNNNGHAYVNTVVGTLDYKKKYSDTTFYEAGIRIRDEHRHQVYTSNIYDYTLQSFVLEDFLSTDYQFYDQIYAAYMNYNSVFHGWLYQAGLRYEETNFSGISNIGDAPIRYHYPSGLNNLTKALFPSLYLSKKIKKTEYQLNITRKITRPDFLQITPIILFSDRQNIRIGNPALRPEFINTIELNNNIQIKSFNILSSLYGKQTTDPISLYLSPWEKDSTVFLNSFINGNVNYQYGLEETVKWSFSKMLEIIVNANGFNTTLYNQGQSVQGWSWTGKFNMTIRPSKTWTFQSTASYRAPQVLLQGKRLDKYYIDLSLRKSFKENMWFLTFMVNDLFNTNIDRYGYQTSSFQQELSRRREIRYYKIVLQYNFGAKKQNNSSGKPKNIKPDNRDSDEGF